MDLLIRDIVLAPIHAAGDLVTKGWYSSNFRAIRELVQDPSYRAEDADPDEPVIEVVIGDAIIQETKDFITPTFVRVSMDGEDVGETSMFKNGPYTKPTWNERFLLHPRGSFAMRFQVIDNHSRMRGQCVIGTQSLWGAASRTGGVSVKVPLTLGQAASGELTVHCRPWDGLPPHRPWWAAAGWSSPGIEERPAEPDLFDMLDKDGDGVLSKEELQSAIIRSKGIDMSPNKATSRGLPTRSVGAAAPLLLPISSRTSLQTQSMEGSNLGPMQPMQPAGAGPMVSSLHPGVLSVRSQQTVSQPTSPLSIPQAVHVAKSQKVQQPFASPVQDPTFASLPAQIGSPVQKVLTQTDAAPLGPAVVPRSISGRQRSERRPLEGRSGTLVREQDDVKAPTAPSISARLKAAGFTS